MWDALVATGRAHALRPAGMLALDVARVEAGLLLTDVDFHSSRKASIDAQMYSPYELGLGRLVALDKGSAFVGREALRREHAAGHRRQIVGLEVRWTDVEAIYERVGLPPTAPAAASRVAVPVYRERRQVGEGDDHGLVADAQAPGGAGDNRPAALRRRDRAADRDHRRGHALHRRGDGRADAVPEAAAPHRPADFVTSAGWCLAPPPRPGQAPDGVADTFVRRGRAGRRGTT